MTINQLVNRINSAPDFGYDDEAVELTQRLAKEGKRWRWSSPDRYDRQHVEIVEAA